MTAPAGGTVVEGRDPATGDVLQVGVEHGTIAEIRRFASRDPDMPYLAPGLVDLQVNGYRDADVNGADVSADAIAEITHALAREGVTTWVPTVVTAAERDIARSLRAVAAAKAADPAVDAAVPWAHVEGPFLSSQDGPRGVHDAVQIRPLDAAEVARWRDAGPVGYVTVSPHAADAPREIARITRLGVRVAVGHTHATSDQVRAAVDAGATMSTHLGNGVHAHLPRHPNAIWAQLADDRLTCGFIADGHHLPADTLRVMLRAKGARRAFLVSDSTALAGSPPGTYRTPVGGDVELTPDGRLAYGGTGLLAGAALSLVHGLRFVLAHTGTALADGLELVCGTPGALVGGATAPRGTIQVGSRADLVRLTANGTVVGVVRGGERLVG
ncbi:N-acetylglucosamine-6-phosphate deacetylase [Krasilnikoviella flava]|uniref:N-acetylglucosamine-6-phosphate deacetylase n=1 Tax=Krasilnikoviella flava TaxID=526729 RepID=A0A1T5L5E3_9MICO|nr:amidohydrolase family protein [Krasilnikoviella flava]SKC70925.1 N-acetylglucosamine-6-phosphate deacetylase [Krasilnikoviella flava]